MIEVDRFENTRVYIVRACVFTVSAPGRRVAIELTHGSSPSHAPPQHRTSCVLDPRPAAYCYSPYPQSAKTGHRRRADGWEVPCRKHAPTSIANSCANCDCTLPS